MQALLQAPAWRISQLLQPHLRPAFALSRAAHASSATEWLAGFVNYEQKGVPAAAGTDTADGFDLDRVLRLLARLGSPQGAWPAVHVAGTKGKGSTVAMLAGALRESGYRVGSYSSPHVCSLHERVCVDGAPVTPDELDALVARHAPAVEAQQGGEGGRLTHFEVLTALAFKHFEEAGVEVAVVEAGLGGARDATNVLPAEGLQAAVVTAVGLDHAEALGGSIESIAAAKAGIFKAGRPAVVARQPSAEAAAVLLRRAEELGCDVLRAEQLAECQAGPIEWVAAGDGSGLGVRQRARLVLLGPAVDALLGPGHEGTGGTRSGADVLLRSEHDEGGAAAVVPVELRLRLVGRHQLDNAAAAVAAAVALKRRGFDRITLASVVRGLEAASLPGRFQVCRLDGLGAGAGGTAGGTIGGTAGGQLTVVLDGAHTADSAAALVDTLLAAFPSAPVAVVLAMAADKPHREFCAQLRRLAPALIAFTEVPVAGSRTRSAPPGALAAAWQASRLPPGAASGGGGRTRELVQASLSAAVAKACGEVAARAPGGGVVVVCGSLHAVGAALRQLDLVPLP